MLGYQLVTTKELELYRRDREQLLSLLHEAQDLRNSIAKKDEIIARYEGLVKTMEKNHVGDVERLENAIKVY